METLLSGQTYIAQSLLRTMTYFDIFSYPLASAEIVEYCDFPELSLAQGAEVLGQLHRSQIISCKDGFYFLDDQTSKIDFRLKGNDLASKRMKAARVYSKIVANFPYVRGV